MARKNVVGSDNTAVGKGKKTASQVHGKFNAAFGGQASVQVARLATARDILSHRLTVDAELTGNGSNLEALPMKF
jgi:hypothetical protein